MKIYLDNCCYSRPYDGQQRLNVQLETEAKLFIQSLVRFGAVKLVTSFVLLEEVSADDDAEKSRTIMKFLDDSASAFVGAEHADALIPTVADITATGVKAACALLAKCDCFVSTDGRLLKYRSDRIKLLNPIDFKKSWEETDHG
jgi:hypothetical protein